MNDRTSVGIIILIFVLLFGQIWIDGVRTGRYPMPVTVKVAVQTLL